MNYTYRLGSLSLVTTLSFLCLAWAKADDSVRAALSELPGTEQALTRLLEELDLAATGNGAHKKRLASLRELSELQAEPVARAYSSLQEANFRPPRELELVEQSLYELFGKPCSKLIEQFQVPLELTNPQACGTHEQNGCRLLNLCRLLHSAFKLDHIKLSEAAQLVAPRARASDSRTELHLGLEEEQEAMAASFSQLQGGANLARLIEQLMVEQSVEKHEQLKLVSSDDVTSVAIQATYEKIYQHSKLATKYRYVVEPFLRLALYEPCESYLTEIRDYVPACTPISNSYACTAARICQLVRISYREKLSNWTEAENHLKEAIQKKSIGSQSRDEISFALSKNQADNYATLKVKLKAYEKERNKYKYY